MNTTTLTLNESWLSRRNTFDWVFAVLVLAGGLFAFTRYGASMDYYEKPILVAALVAMVSLGWFWRPLRVLAIVVAAASLLAISSYQATWRAPTRCSGSSTSCRASRPSCG